MALAPVTLTVHIRKDWTQIADGGGYSSLSATVEYLGIGQWQAIYPAEAPAAAPFIAARLAGEDICRLGIVARDTSGRVLFSGPALTIAITEGASDGRAGDSLTINGITDTGILAGILVVPDEDTDVPTTAGPLAVTHYRQSGPAETVLLAALGDHLGPTAGIPRRRLDALDVPTTAGRGGDVEISGRFTTSLLDLARTCDTVGGIGVRLQQGQQGSLDVDVIEPQDRPEVQLSVAAGTLSGAVLDSSAAEATDAIAGGSGGGLARDFSRATATEPPGGFAFRRERWVNAAGRRDDVEIDQAAAENLAERGAAETLSLASGDSSPWSYLDDFDLGDRITVTIRGVSLTERVSQVLISHTTPGRPRVVPTVGDLAIDYQRDMIARITRQVLASGSQ